MNQISAVRSTLDALGLEILTNHLESRVLKSGNGGEHPKAKTINPEERSRALSDGQPAAGFADLRDVWFCGLASTKHFWTIKSAVYLLLRHQFREEGEWRGITRKS